MDSQLDAELVYGRECYSRHCYLRYEDRMWTPAGSTPYHYLREYRQTYVSSTWNLPWHTLQNGAPHPIQSVNC